MTVAQRFRTLMAVFTPMESTLAEMPRAQFSGCMHWVAAMESKVWDGTWHFDISVPDEHTSASCVSVPDGHASAYRVSPVSATPAYITLAMDCAPEHERPAQSVHEPSGSEDIQHGEPSVSEPVNTASNTRFKLPRQVKQRGRPAQVRQRRFRVKNAKNKRTAQDTAEKDSENCVECGQAEPPKQRRRRGRVGADYDDWTRCDVCFFWYHNCRITNGMPRPDKRFTCLHCTSCLCI